MESNVSHNFFYKNNKNYQIKAAGVLFTKNKNILFQHNTKNNKLVDFGGKVDNNDTSPLYTACRELFEESNGAIYNKNNGQYLTINKLKSIVYNHKYRVIYIKNSKYLLFCVHFPSYLDINIDKIGTYEKLDKIDRIVKWINLNDLQEYKKNNKLHIRLNNNLVVNKILDSLQF